MAAQLPQLALDLGAVRKWQVRHRVRKIVEAVDLTHQRRAGLGVESGQEFQNGLAAISGALNVFPKRTGKLPQAEIRIAQERWEDFKARMDARPRKPPRAAGRDAP